MSVGPHSDRHSINKSVCQSGQASFNKNIGTYNYLLTNNPSICLIDRLTDGVTD